MSEALRELAAHIELKRPAEVLATDIAFGELNVTATLAGLPDFVEFLRADRSCRFSTLVDITAVDHPERPARLVAVKRAVDQSALALTPLDITPVDRADLLRVHDPAHIDAVRAACNDAGVSFGPDTPAGAGSWDAALLAAGADLVCGSGDNAGKVLKAGAPGMRKKISAVACAVERMAATKVVRFRPRLASAMMAVPAAPTAAASVGVKTPA